MTNKIKMSY